MDLSHIISGQDLLIRYIGIAFSCKPLPSKREEYLEKQSEIIELREIFVSYSAVDRLLNLSTANKVVLCVCKVFLFA